MIIPQRESFFSGNNPLMISNRIRQTPLNDILANKARFINHQDSSQVFRSTSLANQDLSMEMQFDNMLKTDNKYEEPEKKEDTRILRTQKSIGNDSIFAMLNNNYEQ